MYKIELTEKEEKLFDKVKSYKLDQEFNERISKLESLQELTFSLLERNAIPKKRYQFLTKKEFQFGQTKKSRWEIFESNGSIGHNIFKHPHFIKYLMYFINGANLDDLLISQIEQIYNKNYYKDDALEEIYNFLKINDKIPKERNSRNCFSEEVFKLLLDFEIELDSCHRLRQKIKTQ